ncbi:hypothetical protein QYM36_017453 [Artemia franciscana]|uniref:Uncharacterized protein n=1 Tax=Artemia franciscana TaxID=6661 RepID=A0AA88HAI9_ARTSF|nr:hypothetical protein QYM36_017453 [Artemia franciscana]
MLTSLANKEADINVKKVQGLTDGNMWTWQAKEAASRGDTRTVYRVKKIVGRSSKERCPIKDEGRRLLTNVEEQMERLASCFETIVSPDTPDQPLFYLCISDDKQTADEILSVAKN